MPKLEDNRPIVCFVIVCWNNRSLLDDCLESIYAQTYRDFQIIIVDNGSSDGSSEHIKQNHPSVILIEAGENLGFAKGNNRGFAQALENPACGYVAALNTDARLDSKWLEHITEFARTNPNAACMQGLTLIEGDHSKVDSAGIFVDLCGAPLQIGYNSPNHGYITKKVFGVNAAAAIYRREFLEAQPFGQDYFDSDLFMYYEDIDISARALCMGWDNYLVVEAIAYHIGSASSGGDPSFMLKMVHRNLPLVFIKNFPLITIIKCLPGLTRAEFKRFMTFWISGQKRLALAMLKGRLRGFLFIPSFALKRLRLKRVWKLKRHALEQLMTA